MEKVHYYNSDDEKQHSFISTINEFLPAFEEEDETRDFVIFDTFDWRLFEKGYYVIKTAAKYSLLSLTGESTAETHNKRKTPPRFAQQFSDQHFREVLQDIIGIRALLPLVEGTIQTKRFSFHNEDSKIVLRGIAEEFTLDTVGSENQPLRLFSLLPVKGYRQELQLAEKALREKNWKKDKRLNYISLLGYAGLEPGRYNPKLNITLDPDMPAGEAVLEIILHQLRIALINVDGMLDDIDIEFLHDFRVSLRRARSALALIKNVFHDDYALPLKNDLTRIAKITNKTRDFDVYLLKEKTYKKILPPMLAPGLPQLFKYLKSERRKEFGTMKKALLAEDIAGSLQHWINEIENIDRHEHMQGELFNTPVKQLAMKLIFTQYRKVIKKGKKNAKDCIEENLHKFRIECKKLRYLLEFFQSLFPEDDISILISRLKKLQDNLGEINDLRFQQDLLTEILENMINKNSNNGMGAAAIGGIMTYSYSTQLREIGMFKNQFGAFNSKKNKAVFKKLFEATGRKEKP